ncbi:MAG: oligosaccharide flippase family protein [Bacteroidales bacterium]|nr:oligosaccharide flippase family protein [Bacteroidales bacterium]
MTELKKLANQTLVYGSTTIIGRLLNYLLVPFHTYIFLDPREYGVVGEMYAYVALLMVVLTYGMETAFFRFSSMENNKLKVFSSSFWTLSITTSLFLFLSLFLSQPIANLLQYPSHPEYIRWFAIIVSLDVISSIPFARLRSENRPFRFAFIKIFNIVVSVFFNLFFLWFCPLMIKNGIGVSFFSYIYRPEIGIGYIFIANLIASALQMLLLITSSKGLKFHIDFSLIKRMLKYALPLLILGLAGIINETFDRILIKNLSSDNLNIAMHNVGVYSACFKIAVIMSLFIQAFRYSAEPFFFSKFKEKDAKESYAVVMTYFVIVCSFIFLATTLFLDYIKYFVSAPYHEGLRVVPIVLLAYMMLGIVFNLSIWYKLTGQTKYGAYISVGGAIITLVVNFNLIPIIGYMGAAWAHFITYLCMMVASYWLGQKHYPINYNLKKISFYIFLALFLFIISYFVIPFDKLTSHKLLIKTIVNGFILLIFIAIIYKKEFKNLRQITQSK